MRAARTKSRRFSLRGGTVLLAGLLTTAAASGIAGAAPFQGALLQAPGLAPPARGSIAGSLSRTAFGPGDLARGAYALPLPIELPQDRGPLGASLVPSYSTEAALGEWGMGWSTDLSIRRYRDRGDLDWVSDDFSSPWGRLRLGDDGYYYPLGLRSVVRVSHTSDGWVAVDGDGNTFRFLERDATTTGDGDLAWALSRVEHVAGDVTELTWVKNASGRTFLTRAEWGGRGATRAYRADLVYETLAQPSASWSSGSPQVLDRRVKTVVVSAANVGGTGMAERFRYALTYTQSPFGPAFYLGSITRSFPSGAVEPAVTYEYDLGAEQLATATLAPDPGLALYLTAGGSRALQPSYASMTDLEQNGTTDVEHYYQYTLLKQNDDGSFTFQDLPPKTGAENPLCRPDPSINNKPRTLARMLPDAGAPHVVVTRHPAGAASTQVLVCDRAGMTLADKQVGGNWELGDNIRLADVDRDALPDVVSVKYGGVQILRNISDANGFNFVALPQQTLTPAFTPVSSWVLDFNGDGEADLLARYSGGVVVWVGQGHGHFVSTGVVLQFRTQTGALLANLPEHEFSFGDFNNDGLVDVLLSRDRSLYLFMNNGLGFTHVVVPGLSGMPWDFSYPVIADLAATGNEQVVFVHGSSADALSLTTPSTGLLRKADDGKGTVLRFGYGRVRPAPGIIKRYSVLASLTVESTGYDPVTYRYDYGQPVWHDIGRYLVGFTWARKLSPVLAESVEFHNDDDISGVPTRTTDVDSRSPGLVRFSRSTLDAASYHGVPWLRLAERVNGFRDGAGTELATRETVEAWDRELCAVRTSVELPGGTLVHEDTLADVPALGDLSCLPGHQELTGLHDDPSLDFDYGVRLERNGIGQLTRAVQEGPDGDLVLQMNGYDAQARLVTSGAPGRGSSSVTYDAMGRVTSVTQPDGVVSRAVAMDPVTDALLTLDLDRGGGTHRSSFYRYDGYERLAASWDDFAGGTSARPLVANSYTWSAGGRPGRIDTTALADAGAGILRRSADLMAADGSVLAAAQLANGVWSFASAGYSERASAASVSGRLASMTDAALTMLTAASLRAQIAPLARSELAGFGHVVSAVATIAEGVTGSHASTLTLAGGQLVTRTVENGSFTRRAGSDAAGRILWAEDEAGVVQRYAYDALGRLVGVTTPDGNHRLHFDGYGRPARVDRDGVASFTYAYDPTSGLPTVKRTLAPSGQPRLSQVNEYDAIGRLSHVEQQDLVSGETRAFDYEYDGHAAQSLIPGQRGQLTRVFGAGYDKRTTFDRAGQLARTTLALGNGWRSLELAPTYYSDGSLRTLRVSVRDGAGALVEEHVRERLLDGAGRTAGLRLDGQPVYTLAYDSDGRVSRADFADGRVLSFDFDATTGARRGYRFDTPGDGTVVSSWNLDARGHVSGENIENDGQAKARHYGYDARGYLTTVDGDGTPARYSYTASGLPLTAADESGARNVHRVGQDLDVGGVHYRWDDLGRVVQRGNVSLGYGPGGQLETASSPGRDVRFVYDENGQRVLKLVDGQPSLAYVAGGVLSAEGFVEPLDVEGVVVGILDHGELVPMLSDSRGTPFLDERGADAWATPYGERSSHGAYAEALDFARLGYDADLGTVRMGVRDYDPRLGQFWTPDPKFLESLESCQRSPVECGLYGYAGNNPLSFSDPEGTEKGDAYWAGSSRVTERHPPGDFDDQFEDWKKENPTSPIIASHELSNGDKVHNSIDYRNSLARLDADYASALPSHKEMDPWYTWSLSNGGRGSHLVFEHIPASDQAEIKAWMIGLNDGASKWQTTTKGDFTVEAWLKTPEVGTVSTGMRGGAGGDDMGWSSSTTDGVTVTTTATLTGETPLPVGKVGGSGSISVANNHSTTDGTSGTNREGRTTSYETKHQAERGQLWIKLTDPKSRVVWIRAYINSSSDQVIVSHGLPPAMNPAGR